MIKKSVIISERHSTSISIEEEFYEQLQRIAAERSISINQLVTEIDNNRSDKNNLSGAVRIFILKYVMENS